MHLQLVLVIVTTPNYFPTSNRKLAIGDERSRDCGIVQRRRTKRHDGAVLLARIGCMPACMECEMREGREGHGRADKMETREAGSRTRDRQLTWMNLNRNKTVR